MEWITCIREAINFMEKNLLEIKSPEEVADYVHMSGLYLQRGFQIVTGYTLGEYMRNRKLYLAAIELADTSTSVIDIALKYGYETPASFDKAFVRFHGFSPSDVRRNRGKIKSFLMLKVNISVQGGENMQFRIEKKEAIKIVGFQREFSIEDSYEKIPKFWDETTRNYASHLMQGLEPVGDMEKYIASHRVGELGVCIDDRNDGKFDYLIAGYSKEDEVPKEFTVKEIPAGTWAVFDCTMKTLQDTNTSIWKEWLPANEEYELAGKYNIEWYSPEGMPGPDQKCQIWIPVVKK
ncbi:MAG: AraC family transcriptional regulator [Clostridiales bacterium]|nr:AraC family transcriptional regulator [Clostridiales bacterium]